VTGPVPAGPRQAAAASNSTQGAAHAKLRKAAHDLEGVFVAELFKAMRETVPEGGILEDSPGQELFQGMMDDRVADLYAGRSPGGLGEALYRQLSRRLPDEGTRP
jgi:peptidoglycan hydrolase FlgJ